MPPKTVKCCICNEVVMKAQTLQIKEGRACRNHEGVQETSNKIQEEIKNDTESSIKKQQDKYKPKVLHKQYDPLVPVCWCCKKKGIRLHDFYLQCIITMKKMELLGKDINFFKLPDQIKENMPEEFKNPLILINIEKKKWIKSKIHFDYQPACSFGDCVLVCSQCLKKLGLEKDFQEQYQRKSNPKIDAKTAYFLGSQMDEYFKEIAKEQLKKEGIKIDTVCKMDSVDS